MEREAKLAEAELAADSNPYLGLPSMAGEGSRLQEVEIVREMAVLIAAASPSLDFGLSEQDVVRSDCKALAAAPGELADWCDLGFEVAAMAVR